MKKYILGLVVLIGILALVTFSYGDTVLIIQAPAAAGGEWQTAFDPTLDSELATVASRNYRTAICANTSDYSGTKVRISITAGPSGNLVIDKTTIGLMTTDDVFDNAPTQITWDTGNDGATINAGTTKVSDEIDFTFTKTNRYGVHIFMANRRYMKYVDSGYCHYYYDMVNEDHSTVLDLEGTPDEGAVAVIDKVEVYVP